jgi:SAM-dependent methyltransferase
MHETSKALIRRSHDKRFATRWLAGEGIDIGSGDDPLSECAPFLPMMGAVRSWDRPDGDAMLMEGVENDRYDFVHSSHCLEHLVDPARALGHWIRICKPGGFVVFLVPDEDLYEQGVFPSTFNPDHKWTFTTGKAQSWSPRSVNVMSLLSQFIETVDVVKIEVLDMNFRFDTARQDQTLSLIGECAIECVLRKRTAAERAQKGRLPPP